MSAVPFSKTNRTITSVFVMHTASHARHHLQDPGSCWGEISASGWTQGSHRKMLLLLDQTVLFPGRPLFEWVKSFLINFTSLSTKQPAFWVYKEQPACESSQGIHLALEGSC